MKRIQNLFLIAMGVILLAANADAGRWLTTDPIEHMERDPQSTSWDIRDQANLYQFNYNNPVNYFDPDGKHPLIILFIAGAVFGGASTPYVANAPGYIAPGVPEPTFPAVTTDAILGNALMGGVLNVGLGGAGMLTDGMPRPIPTTTPCPNLMGQNFGKLGTVVPNPQLRITGFTEHGLDQAITRGVSPQSLLGTVNNPSVVLQQSAGQFLHLSGQSAVVLNPAGRVITTYPSSMFGAHVNAVLRATSPK